MDKKSYTRSGKGRRNSRVKLQGLWERGVKGSDGREQREDRGVVALMSISFGFGVLSAAVTPRSGRKMRKAFLEAFCLG